MAWICPFLLVFSLFVTAKLMVQKRQIAKIKEQIDFCCNRDTQTEITLEKLDKDTQQLAVSINQLLEKYRYTCQKIERNDSLFRDTITSLSHDLRTPLATANGYIQLLLEQGLSSEQREFVEIANERVSVVKQLLDQLFEFARIEANELKLHNQNTDINSILRDVLATYFSEFEKKDIIPSIDIPDVPVLIWVDKDALSRIFSNIIYNALIHGDGEYNISSATNENRCNIIISNRSETICQEDMPHLFNRFYTTDQSRTKKTTGLGLAIARRLTMQMGGEIEAQLQNQIFAIHISFTIHSC